MYYHYCCFSDEENTVWREKEKENKGRLYMGIKLLNHYNFPFVTGNFADFVPKLETHSKVLSN